MPKIYWQNNLLELLYILDNKASPFNIPFDNIMKILVLYHESILLRECQMFW